MDDLEKRMINFSSDWLALQDSTTSCRNAMNELKDRQTACAKSFKHCKYYINYMNQECDKMEKTASAAEKIRIEKIRSTLTNRRFELREIQEVLPADPGSYLRIVLGLGNVALNSKEDKFHYKNDYERFKIVVSAISALLSFILYFFTQIRVLDAFFLFLSVWYYCTLTIRERILIANGSRIKGWWNIYHFISTALAGIMLIWPQSESYDLFRDQFMLYSLYINGYMSWMRRRFTFILPFLCVAYMFQLYNAISLARIGWMPSCSEWQVFAVSAIFFILAIGNTTTVYLVVRQKVRTSAPDQSIYKRHLRRKYSFRADVVADPSRGDNDSEDGNGNGASEATKDT